MVVFARRATAAALRVAACAAALGAGVATARYTDIARCERSALALSSARVASRVGTAGAGGRTLAAIASTHASKPGPNRLDVEARPRARERRAEVPEHALGRSQAAQADKAHDALAAGLARGSIMTGATAHRLILFTFDDGPDRATTPLLLDRLDAAGVRAVFFLTGANLRGENVAERRNQEIARETIRRGHFLGSHGMHHKQLPLLSDLEATREVSETEQILERVLGARPWLIRPPGGARSPRIDKLLGSRGYTTMLWNLGAGDFQVRTAKDVHETWQRVFERRESEGVRGGIVLLHDTYAWSVDAFQLIVQDLLARNCKLLESGDELYDFVDDPRLFFEARAERDESTLASPVRLSAEALESRQTRLREETRQRCNTLARY